MTDYTHIEWGPFFAAYENDTIVSAIVGEVSGNGHQVFVMGIPAYLPQSQHVPGRKVEPGGKVDVCIIKIMPETNNVVVSARVAEKVRAETEAQEIQVGDIVPVRVKNLVEYGAFVQIANGVDGLIFLKELSYNKVHSAEEVVSPGDEFKAKVVKISEKDGKRRIELSLKQALPDPWEDITYQVGDIVEGEVANLADYGAFLNIGTITAMLHRSELSWTKKNPVPREFLSVGDKVRVKIMSIDKEEKRMLVSTREVEGDPWQKLNIKEGTVVEGVIQGKTNFGFFVELGGGIAGLLHKNELAWISDRQKSLMETLKAGDTVRVVVTELDSAKRKLSLSMKHLESHPYDVLVNEHPLGTVFEATVLRNNVPGTMHVSLPAGKFQIFFHPELRYDWDAVKAQYPVDATIPVRITAYDSEAKRLTLVPAI